MKKYTLLFSLTLVGATGWYAYHAMVQSKIPFVPFDESMQLSRYTEVAQSEWAHQVLGITRLLYQKAHVAALAGRLPAKPIPHRIHQIWLGSAVPAQYEKWCKSWKEKHPSWDYKLWTDADVEKLLSQDSFFIGITERMYRNATNYGERSDILRLLLLYHFGGIYVDMDFECLRPFDDLHKHFDFFIGLQPLDVAMVQLGSALIAAIPHHPFILFCIDELRRSEESPYILSRTGPLFMTQSLIAFSPKFSSKSIVFPATYFYPRAYHDPLEDRVKWTRPESYAVHHWSGSWLTPEARVGNTH